MAMCSARRVSAAAALNRISSARRRGSPESELAERLVDGAATPQVAAIQDQLFGAPSRDVGRARKRRDGAAIAWTRARQRQVRLERSRVVLQAGPHALDLDLGSKLASLVCARTDLSPDHADQTPALERPD